MEYRQLGSSGLRVSVLTLGTMTFGGQGVFAKVGSTDLRGAARLVDMAVDAGINHIDTANVYSSGTSEEIIGDVIQGKRDKLLIATKAGMPAGNGPNERGSGRAHLVAQCEASLRRLKTDYIDLYYVHAWDGLTPLEETLGTLQTLQQQGKIRYAGCSNFSGWHVMKALSVAESRGFPRFCSQQIHYTLMAREAEYELVPIAMDQGVGITVWSPLAGGLLSGKYRRSQSPSDGRHLRDWGSPPVHDTDRLYRIVEELVDIAQKRGATAAQVALAWTMRRPGVSNVIVGATSEKQLADNLAAADLVLGDDENTRLAEVSALPLPYPYWHQVRTAKVRLGPADLAFLQDFIRD